MRSFTLALIAATYALPVLAQNQDPQEMIVKLVQAYGHTCGKALHTVPHDGTNQTFDLVCAANANGSGAEHTYVIDLSSGSIVVTPK